MLKNVKNAETNLFLASINTVVNLQQNKSALVTSFLYKLTVQVSSEREVTFSQENNSNSMFRKKEALK